MGASSRASLQESDAANACDISAGEGRRRLEPSSRSAPNVRSFYLLRVVVPDTAALQNFFVGRLSKTLGVANIGSSFALKAGQVQDRPSDFRIRVGAARASLTLTCNRLRGTYNPAFIGYKGRGS